MCRAGGPRCEDKRRAKTALSRDNTDRMAAQISADRKGWDGNPLSDRDRRLYALRESGWTGPIDQDGYAETTGYAADVLRSMAKGRGEKVDW